MDTRQIIQSPATPMTILIPMDLVLLNRRKKNQRKRMKKRTVKEDRR
jgi:hypothetical protein